ncbi:hypothetical protein Moror_7226 [Moniliophthora roreri MCA 2997]|uniref:Uncharacterized protein n=1 Tax=Moniliophthora roreri (strain MCA 2997) TaxID=1381753 RepID=V2XTR1_MONRO|nr:hypothetical protein Moror_7226 [Moniliophthora roreri MCA 2997]
MQAHSLEATFLAFLWPGMTISPLRNLMRHRRPIIVEVFLSHHSLCDMASTICHNEVLVVPTCITMSQSWLLLGER